MGERVKSHRRTKCFTRVEYQPCRESQLSEKERAAITALRPALNRLVPSPIQHPYTRKRESKPKGVRTGINLTAEDRKIIGKLKRQFESEHGKLTATGVIRVALRKALKP
jgi:hypothetical protein